MHNYANDLKIAEWGSPQSENSNLKASLDALSNCPRPIWKPLRLQYISRLSGKESACQCRRHWFDPWARKIPWSRKWQPTPLFLPGKCHGQRIWASYSRRGHQESDTTECTQIHTHTHSNSRLRSQPNLQKKKKNRSFLMCY